MLRAVEGLTPQVETDGEVQQPWEPAHRSLGEGHQGSSIDSDDLVSDLRPERSAVVDLGARRSQDANWSIVGRIPLRSLQ